jgi:alkylhydroperoxidase family enzyme
MDDRHEAARRRLEDEALRGPGHLPAEVREAVAAGRDVPSELRPLVAKVADEAYRVTDEDFAPLRARYSEDELFEVVVSAALGASLARLRAGLRALSEI